jgi:uncharacterized membrane protein
LILAHFTGNDASSFLLVVGLALTLLGGRRLMAHRPQAVRFLAVGVVAFVVGLIVGFVHNGTTP